MARRHIEFIQSQDLPWERPSGAWRPAGVMERLLSADDAVGSCTAEWRLPEGWSHSPGYWGAGVEIFVLDGELQTGAATLRQFSYAYIPAGVNPGRLASRTGCRLLWMPDGPHPFTSAAAHREGALRHRYIAAIDTDVVPWASTITPGFPPGAMRKSLRIDPDTGASTWLLGVLPQWSEARAEIHPVSEEAYQLLGEMDGDRGRFVPGCYFWRPPHVPHGPFGTKTGSLTFFRTEGALITYYVDPRHQAARATEEGAS
jgi:hypothetical protein